MQNRKKGLFNIASSFLSQIITLLLGIIIPRLVLVNLGSEANGLLNSVSNILVYVALLEAGVGATATQALYAPLARNDRYGISGIVAAVDRLYKRTGRYYFAVILLLTFVFPFTITSELPRWQIMAVIFLSGMPGVIKYYFQGKYTILLSTEGRGYVLTNLSTAIHILTSIAKIILLLSGFGIVALQLMYLSFNVIQVLFIMYYVKKHYPWLDSKVTPDYSATAQSKNAFVHQVSSLVFFNTDVIILTYFCGLKTVSVYSMYTMLFGIIGSAIANFGGANFILGQTFNTDRRRFVKLLDVYEIFNITLTFSLYCIAGMFILPFLRLYTSGVGDINYIDPYLPYLFIATYLLSNGRSSSSLVISYAVHYRQTQWRAILESVINITVSIACVFRFGMYGVLIGTIAAMLYRANDMIIYANRRILGRSPWKTYRRWLVNMALFISVTLLSRLIFSQIALDSYVKIISCAAVTCVVVVPLFFAVSALFDKEAFRYAKEEVIRPTAERIKQKLHISHR